MKSKLIFSTAVVLFLASAMTCALGQAPGTLGIDPRTGLPMSQPQSFNPATGQPVSQQPPVAFDPTTGQPIAQAVPDWKDADWKDPDITLTNVVFDNLPLSEIARALTDQFKQQFDVLLPGNTSGATYVNGQMIRAGWDNDWLLEQITLRLKNVTASEIFSAMNLLFENNRTPLRWELKVNGRRQIALLHVLQDPMPVGNPFTPAVTPEAQRRVYWVGNLIGDEKNGGMSMEQIIKTITDVWSMAKDNGGNIQFHKEAQLLVVSGTPDQIDFMEQTLKALREKAVQEKNGQEVPLTVQRTLKTPDQKVNQPKTNSGTTGR